MKRTIDIDSLQVDSELELRLGNKAYAVKAFDKDLLDKIQALSNDFDEEKDSMVDLLANQLFLFTGEPADTFRKIDARKLSAAIKRIMEEISEAGQRRSDRKKLRR